MNDISVNSTLFPPCGFQRAARTICMHFFPDFQSTVASHFSRSERLFRLQKAAAARNSSLHSAFFHVPHRVPQNHFPSFSTDGTQTSGLMVELLHDALFPIFLSLVSAGGGKKTRNGKRERRKHFLSFPHPSFLFFSVNPPLSPRGKDRQWGGGGDE